MHKPSKNVVRRTKVRVDALENALPYEVADIVGLVEALAQKATVGQASVVEGDEGPMGPPGAQGSSGVDGRDGHTIRGEDGEDGRDGVVQQPLNFPGTTTSFLRGDGQFASPTAAASISQTEIDFGSTGVSEASFTITDAAVSGTSKLIGNVAYVAPTGKDLDELDMDQLDLKFAPGTGEFTLYATALNDCLVAGAFVINYQVGA